MPNSETSITLKLNASPEAITDDYRRQIETAALAVAVSLGVCGITDDLVNRRTELITKASKVPQVQTDQEEADALKVFREIRELEKEVERQEELLKGPLNKGKNRIIRLVEEELKPAQTARKRLGDMIDGYEKEKKEAAERQQREAAERQRAAEEAARKAEEEAARIARGEELTRQREEEAARERKVAEDLLKNANNPDVRAAAEKAAQEAAEREEQAKQEAAKLEEQKLSAQLEAEELAMQPTAQVAEITTIKGVSAKKVFDFHVIGSNAIEKKKSLIQLAVKYPELVNITERRQDIIDKLNGKATAFPEPPPGLTVFETVNTKIR